MKRKKKNNSGDGQLVWTFIVVLGLGATAVYHSITPPRELASAISPDAAESVYVRPSPNPKKQPLQNGTQQAGLVPAPRLPASTN